MIANCAISSDAIVNDVMRIVAWLPRPDAGDPREPDGSRRRSLRWLLAAHLGTGRASPRTEGRTVYAVDDVHGRYDLLMALLDAIVEDLRGLSGRESPVLVMFGDYVDRGPRSADVLAALDRLTAQDRIELNLLKGNHEAAMPAHLEEPEAALGWLRVGGDATMRSYGVEPPDPAAPTEDHRQACNRLRDRIAASHLRLLERLKHRRHRRLCLRPRRIAARRAARPAASRGSTMDPRWFRRSRPPFRWDRRPRPHLDLSQTGGAPSPHRHRYRPVSDRRADRATARRRRAPLPPGSRRSRTPGPPRLGRGAAQV